MTDPQPRRAAPKPRPRDLDTLGFRRRQATRWYHPAVLADAALRLLISMAFGAFLDKRELQGALAAEVYDVPEDARRRGAADSELWIDYIADTGDGFPATYTVAWLAAQPGVLPEGGTAVLPGGPAGCSVATRCTRWPTPTPTWTNRRCATSVRSARGWRPATG